MKGVEGVKRRDTMTCCLRGVCVNFWDEHVTE